VKHCISPLSGRSVSGWPVPGRDYGWIEGGQLVPEAGAESEPGSYQLRGTFAEYNSLFPWRYFSFLVISLFLSLHSDASITVSFSSLKSATPAMQSVTMLSAFGPSVRGVSPYSDQLVAALDSGNDVTISPLDFESIYPAFLVPARTDGHGQIDNAVVHWGHPASWKRAAVLSDPVMHIQYWTVLSAFYLSGIAKQLHKHDKKCVITVHNPEPHETIPLFGRFEKKLLNLADRLIVHSESEKELLCARSPDLADKIRVIPHGIVSHAPVAAGSADYELAGLTPERRYVLIFGNLRGYKGVPTLLRAWRNVIQENSDADLVIAGRFWNKERGAASWLTARMLGTERTAQEINALLQDGRLSERVILRDQFVPDDVLDALCRLASLAVFPYDRFSGQSGAATRAASWGTPLLVSNVGGLPGLAINSDYIFEPGADRELARIMLQLLAAPEQPGSVRQKQHAHNEQFCWDKIAAQHAAVYREIYG
jgi:glycosyltransferase involved in cell wall biosynthesis